MRVKRIPQAVTDEIDGKDGEDDQYAREDPQPWGALDILVSPIEHISPSGGWRPHSHSQETHICFTDDGICHPQGGADNDGRHCIGQDVPKDDRPA